MGYQKIKGHTFKSNTEKSPIAINAMCYTFDH